MYSFMDPDAPEHADVQQLCDLANDTAGWAKHINDTFPTKKNNDTEPPNYFNSTDFFYVLTCFTIGR